MLQKSTPIFLIRKILFFPAVTLAVVTTCRLIFKWPTADHKNLAIRLVASAAYKTCFTNALHRAHNSTVANGWLVYNMLQSSGTKVNKQDYWNEEERFRPLRMPLKNCVIIYCGANTAGTDGVHFASAYPTCEIYFLEPVTPFYQKLLHSPDILKLLESDRSSRYHLYSYGLSNRTIFIDLNNTVLSETQGSSLTQIAQPTAGNRYKIVLRDIVEFLEEFGIISTKQGVIRGELTLLHMDCEGCEYDVLERLTQTGLIQYIRYIQFGSHRPKEMLSLITDRYCFLQETLKQYHNCVFGIPWGWERWNNRKYSS